MTKISFLIIVFAVVFLSGCIGETDIIRGNEGVFDIEINNTNLAPSVPGETVGTGERVHGVTYYANETPIEIFVWGHGQNVSQTAEIHLFINGTKVADTSGRPLGASEQSNKTIVAMIPRYASYKIEANNAHHYEWREYRVIAGTNGSVITNNYYTNTTGGGGVSFNGTPVDLNGSNLHNGTFNDVNLSLKVNKTGDTMSGTLDMGFNRINRTSFVDIKNSGTAGFDVQNTATDIVNSLAVGTVGNSNIYGNWNSTTNTQANTSLSSWSIRPGVVGSQEGLFRIIWFREGFTPGLEEYIIQAYKNQTLTITTKATTINGNVTMTNLTGAGNSYVCVYANGTLYRGSPTC